ncbi:hypothetical protein [Aminivibrio sp.]|uniref:hypothetical protein n=1 Tax=Aminivibrio sp. TaxID=1872489 RepID=UPI001A4A888E|nr:hypothetical protein [Aminivibrio sp.]MBL3540231.1 hypothetical protein [Aminivibrio sp.]
MSPSRWTIPEDGGWEDGVFGDGPSWRRRLFTVTAMAFQDGWTIDTERLRRCPIKAVAAGGTLFPFCAFTAASRVGRSLYGNAP